MKCHWHPVSTVVVPELGGYASPAMVRMLLAAGSLELLYAGDRMWPAIRHGTRLAVVPQEGVPVPGSLVLAELNGIPEVLRVLRLVGDGQRIELSADADPADPREVALGSVLGLVRPGAGPGRTPAALRRIALEIAEAWRGRPDEEQAASVRRKYESQAAYYAATPQCLDPALAQRLLHRIGAPGRILVAGCGAGGECFGLAAAGWDVRGIDFSPAMIDHARRLGADLPHSIDFVVGDLATHEEPGGSLDAVLFTYDVYSFLPDPAARIELLRKMARWLRDGGSVFVSARLAARPWTGLILTVQWLASAARGLAGWGDSHTRYVDPDGTLRRSFVHYFTARGLYREIRRAGLRPGSFRAGHVAAHPFEDEAR